MRGKIAAALAGAALVVAPVTSASADILQLPPPGAWYASENVQCASLNVPKGGREGVIHQWVWKYHDGVLRCEFAGSRKVRS